MSTQTIEQETIQVIRKNFNKDHYIIRFIKNLFTRSKQPKWMNADDPLSEQYRQQLKLLNHGNIVWAAVVQANNLLFKDGPMDHPVHIVYSSTQDFDNNPEYLSEVASKIYSLKNAVPDDIQLSKLAEMVTNEQERGLDWELPSSLTNASIRSTTFVFAREHSPNRILSSNKIPILIHPSTHACMMVPSRFWTQKLTDSWSNPEQKQEQEQEQEIYQKIGELLWSIMPEEATVIYFTGDIYPEHWSGGADWLLKNGKIESFLFGESPYEIESQIYELMKKLRSLDMFAEKWTNYKITLTETGKIDFEFAYIPEEDHWPGLLMKGVSELKEDELDLHNIPFEEWEMRIKHREQNKD